MTVRTRIAKLEASRPPELLDRMERARQLIAEDIPRQIEWLLSWGPPSAESVAEAKTLWGHLRP